MDSNKPERSQRALITKLYNSDGTVDYCFDEDMLNEVLEPFIKKENNNELNNKTMQTTTSYKS